MALPKNINLRPYSVCSILKLSEWDEKTLETVLVTHPDALDFCPDYEAYDFEKNYQNLKYAVNYITTKEKCPLIFITSPNLNEPDIDAHLMSLVSLRPQGIILKKFLTPKELTQLSVKLSVCEAAHNLSEHTTEIIATISTASALLQLYHQATIPTQRLCALGWDHQELSLDLALDANMDDNSPFDVPPPLLLAQSLIPLSSAALAICAIDTSLPSLVSLSNFQYHCKTAKNAGFRGKFATSTDQVKIINRIFKT